MGDVIKAESRLIFFMMSLLPLDSFAENILKLWCGICPSTRCCHFSILDVNDLFPLLSLVAALIGQICKFKLDGTEKVFLVQLLLNLIV